MPVTTGLPAATSEISDKSRRIDAGNSLQRFLLRDQSFMHEIDGDPQRRARRPLRGARLQDPQFAVLDR